MQFMNKTQDIPSHIYTVSQLTEHIRASFEEKFSFIWVEGEISNFSAHTSSGHYYMIIKDSEASIKAVIFNSKVRDMHFRPENGINIIAYGRISVYALRGEYQLIIDYIEPIGTGMFTVAFERLKNKLASEGLFRHDIKKAIPFIPRRVIIITSPSGAAIQDFLNVATRRFVNLNITILPVRVQGEGSAEEITTAIDFANQIFSGDDDVIVLTRGGGSIEDLWAFNEELVARAIYRSRIPIISAVGHEIDFTIADMAADLRAPTPSAAAELLIKDKNVLAESIVSLNVRLKNAMQHLVSSYNNELKILKMSIKHHEKCVADYLLKLDDLTCRLINASGNILRLSQVSLGSKAALLTTNRLFERISKLKQHIGYMNVRLDMAAKQSASKYKVDLKILSQRITDMNPMIILGRGYSITKNKAGIILTNESQVLPGEEVTVILAEGGILCDVVKPLSAKNKNSD